ncbi:MAG: S8 family serine peptidase, partial [Boseongicola sp.]|nr:S8 family serine peptidase [Boseongicola sp.]
MNGNRMKLNALAAAFAGLLAACGGGPPVGEGSVPHQEGGPTPPPAPGSANPTGLDFRATALGAPAAPDGRNWRTAEYLGHWGLDAISAHEAYARGHFGQGVTIAIADDGFDPTHPDLAGRIRAPRHVVHRDANVFEPGYGGQPGEGHGTYVALVAAGASGNAGGPFGIDIEGGRVIPTKNAHGVAPQASVMPIQLSGGGHPAEAIRHAAANGAQVVNLSIGLHWGYYGEFAGRDGVWLTTPLPIFRPLIGSELGRRHTGTPRILDDFGEIAGILGGNDMTVVWSAGNDGWNAVNNHVHMCGKNFIGEDGCPLGQGPVSAVDFMENFSWLYDRDDPSRKLRFRDMWGECGSGSCADYNSGGSWYAGPQFEPGLLGKWLVVGALGRHGEIAGFSNGCGEARNWCVL